MQQCQRDACQCARRPAGGLPAGGGALGRGRRADAAGHGGVRPAAERDLVLIFPSAGSLKQTLPGAVQTPAHCSVFIKYSTSLFFF